MTRSNILLIMEDVAKENNQCFINACKHIAEGRRHKFKLTDSISKIKVENVTLFFNEAN
ncbi:MAG: hypothetical protein ACYSTS_19450 [Planctomycetota bacterium]